MLRLINIRRLALFSSQNVSSTLGNDIYTRTCSYCNHHFKPHFRTGTTFPSRSQSTSTCTAVQNNSTKKKKRKNRKKYAELLEVTGSSTSQTKASVSKLRAKDLSLLTEQPDINLSELHNLKKLSSSSTTQSHQKIVGCEQPAIANELYEFDKVNGQSFEHESDVGNPEVFPNLSPIDIDHPSQLNELNPSIDEAFEHVILKEGTEEEIEFGDSSFIPEKAVLPKTSSDLKLKRNEKKSKSISYKDHEREQMAKIKSQDLELSGKTENLSRSLYSYLDLCVSCGFLNRGLATIQYYRARHKYNKKMPPVKDVKLYNILLHGFAGKCNLTKVREILQIIKEDELPLNAQSYAACFECVGRLPNSENNYKLLKMWREQLEEQGFSLNDIIAESVFVTDQRGITVKAIQRLEPQFQPVIPPPDTCYSCSLLQDLNRSEVKKYVSPTGDLLSSKRLRQLARDQVKLESNNYVKVKSIEKRSETTETIQYYRSKLEETQEEWRRTITNAFKRDLQVLYAQHDKIKSQRFFDLYPYLKVLDPTQYTEFIIQEIRKLAEGSETFSPTTYQLYRSLGMLVQRMYQMKYKKNTGVLNKIQNLYDNYCTWYLNPEDTPFKNTREYWQYLVHTNEQGQTLDMEEKQWPSAVQIGIGKFLYNIILREIKINVNIMKRNSETPHLIPAFYTVYRTQGRLLKEEIKPHPTLSRMFRGAAQENLVFEVTSVPMICPPIPWSSVSNGGYLIAKADIIRLPQQAAQQKQRLFETPKQNLYPALDSLNQLGAVPWIVNKQVLDTVIQVFNSGGSQKLDIPEPPSACPPPDAITPEMTKAERFQVHRQRMNLRRHKAEMYSLWCDTLYRLSLANHFRDKIFWLPHNMDFRGRVYPCPPHLNHLGSDMARALLCFAKGEPLGKMGFDWLKIHLVNLTGLKKRDTLADRLAYAEEILPEVIESAENPLTGHMWWTQSEEPWQTLACCMEIAKVLKSPDPENFICHFPVHQDGSCNGLQHYAALGRDSAGAESVNLTPSIKPQDVYACVSALVERERLKDSNNGVKIAQILDGFVSRKVIKQTVMTTVYGVTKFGARLQIARQLKDIENFPKEYIWQGSTYLVSKTFESLQEMFTSTKEIQDWFTDCARLISQVCGQHVEWVTPLGLPIVQPYNRLSRKMDFKSPQKLQENFSTDQIERPNVMKQKNAFPPNFIHSLDSSHMMLTSLFCEQKGITFVSVHDCYWTHPISVDIMNKICREQFVALHSQPILEDLSEFLTRKYSYSPRDFARDGSVVDMAKHRLNRILKKLPSTGDFQLENVLDSVYFFS